MAVYPTWKIRYGIGIEIDWGITTPYAPTTAGVAAGTNIPTYVNGVSAGGPAGIWLTNQPDFNPGQEFVDTRKATGTSYRKTGEYLQSLKKPTATFEWEANAYNIAPFVYSLLFKKATDGVIEAAGTPYVKTFYAFGVNPDYTALNATYASPTWDATVNTGNLPIALSLTKDIFQSATAESHRLCGAIPASIKFSGSEGQPLMISAEMLGKYLATQMDASSGTYQVACTSDGVDRVPLMWQDATVKLGGALATINCSTWELNLANGLALKFGDAQQANRAIFSGFTGTGSFTFAWDGANTELDLMVAGTDQRMQVYWGAAVTAATTGELGFDYNLRYTSVEMADGDGEIIVNCNFEIVDDGATPSANGPITITMADTLDYGAA